MTIKHEDWLAKQRARELASLAIPHEYKGKGWDDFEVHDGNRDAVEAVKVWVKSGEALKPSSPKAGLGLLLCGRPGTGKTLLASLVAKDLVGRARRPGLVHFQTMEGFNRARLRKMELGKIMDRSDADGLVEEWMERDAEIQRCYDVRVLVLDDLGQENMTDHLARQVNELLRYRHGQARPTIITSNVAPDAWETHFANGALGSFIFQACLPVFFTGDDQRSKGWIT